MRFLITSLAADVSLMCAAAKCFTLILALSLSLSLFISLATTTPTSVYYWQFKTADVSSKNNNKQHSTFNIQQWNTNKQYKQKLFGKEINTRLKPVSMAPFVQTRKYLTDTCSTNKKKKWKKNASCNCANLRKLFATTYFAAKCCSVLCLTRWLAALDSSDDPTTLTDLPLTTITTVTATRWHRINQVEPPNSSWWFISTEAQLADTPRTLT